MVLGGSVPDGTSTLSPGPQNRLLAVDEKCPSVDRTQREGLPPNRTDRGFVLTVFVGPLGGLKGQPVSRLGVLVVDSAHVRDPEGPDPPSSTFGPRTTSVPFGDWEGTGSENHSRLPDTPLTVRVGHVGRENV